jgi:hypothetical protein
VVRGGEVSLQAKYCGRNMAPHSLSHTHTDRDTNTHTDTHSDTHTLASLGECTGQAKYSGRNRPYLSSAHMVFWRCQEQGREGAVEG